MQSLSVLLCLMTLFAFFIASGNIKVDFIDSTASSNLEDDLILDVVNNTNLTFLRIAEVNINVSLRNTCKINSQSGQKSKGNFTEEGGPKRAKRCLQNIDNCIKEDLRYESALTHLTSYMFNSYPPLDLGVVDGVTKQCKYQSDHYLEALKKFELWALSMYDSSAKLPSGILSGNVNQLGDFDLCLDSFSRKWDIQGQYCLANIQIDEPSSPYLQAIHSLAYSYSPFKSKLQDPGHRVPRYSSINWALCVPNSCSANDVALGLREVVDRVFNNTGMTVQLQVDPSMCQTKSEEPLPFSTKLVGLLFLLVIAIVGISSICDYFEVLQSNEWLMCFSLKKNSKTLFCTKRPANDIEAIHGIRFLNAACLLVAHKSLALFFVPYMNRTEMSEIIGKPWTVLGRAASLYTDPFIMMSGTLTAYSFVNRLKKSSRINIWKEYFSRIMRIVPALAAVILFCTFILPFLNNGPQWNQVVTHHSTICKQYWWRNLLFIHNYFGFKNMCLTHTHHTGIDTQLFFLSPFLVMMLWKWPRKGSLVLVTIAIISTIMRFRATYTKHLSNYIHYGTSIEQLFSTADNMYTLPAHRLTVYIMGIFVGYFLQMFKNVKLNEIQLWIGHAVATGFLIMSLAVPSPMGDIEYLYNPLHAALYAAIVPIFWCLPFIWAIFVHHLGYKVIILGDLIKWTGFLVTTRISYTIYLTQFPVFFYNIGITRYADYYGFFLKNINFKETAWIVFLSTVLTLMIEMPFNNIRNILLNTQKVKDQSTKKMK